MIRTPGGEVRRSDELYDSKHFPAYNASMLNVDANLDSFPLPSETTKSAFEEIPGEKEIPNTTEFAFVKNGGFLENRPEARLSVVYRGSCSTDSGGQTRGSRATSTPRRGAPRRSTLHPAGQRQST